MKDSRCLLSAAFPHGQRSPYREGRSSDPVDSNHFPILLLAIFGKTRYNRNSFKTILISIWRSCIMAEEKGVNLKAKKFEMAEEKRVNLKAQKFEAYTQANKMDFFVKNEMKDDADTVVFQSNLKVEGQTIPLGIITDNTIYTIIRVQIGSQLLKDENKLALLEYLNQLNRSYKVFKYVAAEDGSIFLDACLPSTNESFDAEIVRVILDVIVDHLNNEYKNIMKQAWK